MIIQNLWRNGHPLPDTREFDGQGLTEYGLILALVSIAAVAILTLLGPTVSDMFQVALDSLQAAD